MPILEIACFDREHALIAAQAGADRIELCLDAESGGVTPAYDDLCHVQANVSVPVFVMIRPRAGSFIYTTAELATMKADIQRYKSHADGFVFGVLGHDGTVDVPNTTELVRLADPLPCTFHRAFDKLSDPLQGLEDVVNTGCSAILTSGGAPSAIEGITVLAKLLDRAAARIVIIFGGGVRSSNLPMLHRMKAAAFHSSAIDKRTGKPDADEIRTLKRMLLTDEP